MWPCPSCSTATCKLLWFDLKFWVDTSRPCIFSSLSRLQNHSFLMTCCFGGMEWWEMEHFPRNSSNVYLNSQDWTKAENTILSHLQCFSCAFVIDFLPILYIIYNITSPEHHPLFTIQLTPAVHGTGVITLNPSACYSTLQSIFQSVSDVSKK